MRDESSTGVMAKHLEPWRLPLIFIGSFSALHILYAVLLIASPTAANATAPANIVGYIPGGRFVTAVLLIAAAVSAFWVVFYEWPPSWKTLAMLLPQTTFLFLAGVGAFQAVASGAFADGVERSRYFILADQGWWIIALVIHNWSVIAFHGKSMSGRWRH